MMLFVKIFQEWSASKTHAVYNSIIELIIAEAWLDSDQCSFGASIDIIDILNTIALEFLKNINYFYEYWPICFIGY